MKHYRLRVVGLCLMSCSLLSCVKQSEKITLMQGRSLEEQGDYIGALDVYQKMQHPGFRQTCTGNLHYLYGDILDAMLARRDAPDNPQNHYLLGKAYYDKAATFPRELEVTPNIAFDSQAYFETRRNDFQQQALEELTTAADLNPKDDKALLLQAILYEERDNTEKAIPLYRHLLSQQATSANPIVSSHLGQLLYRQGQADEGIKLVEQAVGHAPENAEAHAILAGLYAEEGEEMLAIGHFQQTICADPHAIETFYRLAQMHLSSGKLIDAERILRLGVTQNPDALQLGLFYTALNAQLSAQEEDEANAIIREIGGEAPEDETAAINMTTLSPLLQIRYLKLRKKLIQRQRPYRLPCASEEENPYFANQLKQTRERIERLEQVVSELNQTP